MKGFKVSILLIVSCGLVLGDKCLSKKLLTPFNCFVEENGGLSIDSHGPEKREEINDVFDRISKYNMTFSKVSLTSKVLPYLRKEFFKNSKIVSAIFKLEGLTSIHLSAFFGQEDSLASLKFLNTAMSSIPTRMLQFLNSLIEFSYEDSKDVAVVEEDAFQGLACAKTLTSLSYKNNGIISVEKGAFSDLINLRNLDLSGNKLKKLKANVFPKTAKIRSLNLENNSLKKIPDELFDRLPVDANINLSNNSIAEVTSDVLRKILMKFITIDYTGNPMQCSCSMSTIVSANAHGIANVYKGSCSDETGNDIPFEKLTQAQLKNCPDNSNQDFKAVIRRNLGGMF